MKTASPRGRSAAPFFVVLMLVTACGAPLERSYGERLDGDRYSIDGVPLPHARWVQLAARNGDAAAAGEFRFRTEVGSVELAADDAGETALELLIFESTPGDADVSLKNGEIVITTKSRGPVGRGQLRGKLPKNTSLQLATRDGALSVAGFESLGDLRLSSASGAIRVEQLRCSLLQITSVDGAMNVRAARARAGEFHNDRGTTDLIDCIFHGVVSARTVGGAVSLHGGDYTSVSVDAVDANITFENCKIVTANANTGSGDIITIGAVFANPPRLTSARGAVKR